MRHQSMFTMSALTTVAHGMVTPAHASIVACVGMRRRMRSGGSDRSVSPSRHVGQTSRGGDDVGRRAGGG